ncbi:hypothetical protein B0H17DRAFT_1141614 [Mycena rosella]|uniref:Uncharacterized protein n=1 Tax=Mycena rosella TaxID=1033263 RepID=A0AAD7CZC9_MYCRO|nr:hypothetical protein B0H17DRAFT_1141614 [Mycena rosella]
MPHLMFASEPSSVSPRLRRVSELEIADHSISPSAAQRRSPPDELKQPPKPRSRHCFVCGTKGRHPLDFRVCPRTAVLLCRSLAKINDEGCLVSFDGSPLPMTRHPGGVAAHMLSRLPKPTRIVPELPEPLPTPRVVMWTAVLRCEIDGIRGVARSATRVFTQWKPGSRVRFRAGHERRDVSANYVAKCGEGNELTGPSKIQLRN